MTDVLPTKWTRQAIRALAIHSKDNRVGLFYRNTPVTTPNGHWISHTKRDIIHAILREAWMTGTLDVTDLNYYSLYATQHDLLAESFPEFMQSVPHIISHHDITLHRSPGPEQIEQVWAWRTVVDWLKTHQCTLPNGAQRPDVRLLDAVTQALQGLHPAQQSAVLTLYSNHRASLLMVLMLVLGQCTAEEYADALLVASVADHPVFGGTDTKAYTKEMRVLMRDAQIIVDYCTIMMRK